MPLTMALFYSGVPVRQWANMHNTRHPACKLLKLSDKQRTMRWRGVKLLSCIKNVFFHIPPLLWFVKMSVATKVCFSSVVFLYFDDVGSVLLCLVGFIPAGTSAQWKWSEDSPAAELLDKLQSDCHLSCIVATQQHVLTLFTTTDTLVHRPSVSGLTESLQDTCRWYKVNKDINKSCHSVRLINPHM